MLILGIWLFAAAAARRLSRRLSKPVDYTSQIKPILTKQCVSCHGAAKPRAGLRLDTAAAALQGEKKGRRSSRRAARAR